MTDLKAELQLKLTASRAGLLAAADGLTEYDLRRPMTPSGTNLLGLIKHLAGIEYVYLGDSVGRPGPVLPWVADGTVWAGADMWAKADESSADLIQLYRDACRHSDESLAALDLESPASVPHWPAERRGTTMAVLLIRMVAETAQHAGHADILREWIDGKGGPDHDGLGDETVWTDYLAQVAAAAEAHRS